MKDREEIVSSVGESKEEGVVLLLTNNWRGMGLP